MNKFWIRDSIFYKILFPMISVLVTSSFILTISQIYFESEVSKSYEARRLSMKVQVSALEMRREQDEFLLQDLENPEYLKSHQSVNLKEQESFYRTSQELLEQLKKVASRESFFKIEKLKAVLKLSHEHFSIFLTSFDQEKQNKESSLSLQTKKNSFYKDILEVEPLVHELVLDQERQVKSKKFLLHMASAFFIVFFLFFEIFLIHTLTHCIVDPLLHLKKKVTRLKLKGGNFYQSTSSIEEINSLEKAFFDLFQGLEKSQKQLLQSQKMESIGTLAGGVAHDFNNLLGGILGCVGLLKKKLNKNTEAINELDVIEQTAIRGGQLTKQILGFARKDKVEKTKLDVNKVILECCSILQHTVEKSITIKTKLAEKIPMIEGDAGQVLQTLMNLAVNARDAMPNGGQLLFESQKIEVDDHFAKSHGNIKPGGYVRVCVSDTGTGIPQDIQQKIFDPFFTTKAAGKGTGLGLSVVYGILKNHGGAVTLYSEVGCGTQFYLYFPALSETKEAADSTAQVKQKISAPNSNRLLKRTILVVDDEALMRDVTKSFLESEGANLLVATNGEEAMSLLQQNHFQVDLVLTDVNMPKMGGIQILEQVRKRNQTIPIVFSSGYSSESCTIQSGQDAHTGFIQKPYRSEELMSMILSQLEKSEKPKLSA